MACLGRACRCRWGASAPAWRGQALGLSRASLRYPTAEDEAAFLASNSDNLCRVFRSVLVVGLLTKAWVLAQRVGGAPADASGAARRLILHQYVILCTRMIVELALVAVISVPRLLQSVSAHTRERVVVLVGLLHLVPTFTTYYLAKLYGFSDPEEVLPELAGQTDSLMLMHLCILLLVGHIMPVRWCLLVAVEALAVAKYRLCVLLLGSPEPEAARPLVLFTVFVVLISIGKRQSEVGERLLGSAFLAEKTLRMQAELELSQAVPPRSSRGAAQGGDRDEVDTTVSGEAFGGLGCEVQAGPSLRTIWEIGRKEQWLLSQEEVVAHPHVHLGSGGFGIVVGGEYHGSPVALKLHTKACSARPLFDIGDLGNELRVLRRLRHPNIVLFHGACINMERRDMVLVMERLVGEPMPQFVARQPPAVDRWKSLADICSALMYLHSRRPPVAHGDLKPANVFVESRGEEVHAKLLDFGLSRLLTRSAKPGGGTYRWMAPGTLMPNGPVRVENDVFAYGLVMYFTATGQRPFNSLSDGALKAYATDRGAARPALDWPSEMSGFVAQCRSVADPCMRELCEERSPMEQVHESLCRLDEGRGRGACSAAQPGLWQQVPLARHIAARSAHTRALRPQKERAARAGRSDLAPVPEQDAVGGAGASDPACPYRHPGLHPTPTDTMIVSLMDMLCSWNHPLALDRCCNFHAALHVVSCLCTELAGSRCGQMRLAGMDVNQCPACRSVVYSGGEAEGGIFCRWCQYDDSSDRGARATTPEPSNEGRLSL